jgi:hypothetical protein
LAVGGITFNAMTRDCAYWAASILMPLEYPFIELGMREGVFMGTEKFSQNLRIEVCPYTSIPQVFLSQSQHRVQKILKKSPLSVSQWAKSSTCLISEAGAVVFIIFDYALWHSLDKQRIVGPIQLVRAIPETL